ncbi:uncharacterized protein N7482_003305 [Penicillium canariense]|uniref:Rhodopsin domain-containing protein n=1 Tax=Penicillium canariense TaxID=189055 RepID=A0A9W9LP10_9EURO|nr:uncharacterized protein N7482_003305 [Penicillium canariense]KAJ5167711.1 hypothetical protein N7482_003305 [Penicillium canariense]
MSSQQSSGHTWTEGDFEHPNQAIRHSLIVALVFAFTLPTVAVGLRLLARRLTGNRLFLDDYLIIVALLFKYGCSIGVVILLFNGLGSHIETVPKENVERFFKIGWANPFVYTANVMFIKLSILALYRRLFSTKYMLFAIYTMGMVVILWAVTIWVAATLNCIPVPKFWDRAIEGACIDPNSFYYGTQIPNIVSDVILLLMPQGVVWSLPVAKSQKLLLSCIFMVGGLALIFDIVRLLAMLHLSTQGNDITYHQMPVVMWTCTEAGVGIIAACLPNLRPLFKVGGRSFWSQLRSMSQGSGKAHLHPSSTGTSSTTGNVSLAKGPVDSCVAEEGIEIHRYSNIIAASEK